MTLTPRSHRLLEYGYGNGDYGGPKRLFVVAPTAAALRDSRYVKDPEQVEKQLEHLSRLREFGSYDEIYFNTEDELVKKLYQSKLGDIINTTPKKTLSMLESVVSIFKIMFFFTTYAFTYASSCTLATALPEGSFMFLKASSQSKAIFVLQATLASCGTHKAAASLGKCS